MKRSSPACLLYTSYIDEGISGTSVNKRGSFLRMIDDAHLDKFDFIITKEVSRFARNTLDSIKYTQDLLAHGIGVFFQSDNINTLMPDSELRLTIMADVYKRQNMGGNKQNSTSIAFINSISPLLVNVKCEN